MSQQIPSSVVENLAVSQGDRPNEHSTQSRKVTTNVTLNPRDSALDTLPSIHWSDLPKAPPNALNSANGFDSGMTSKSTQSMAVETSNRDNIDGRRINVPDGRGEMPPQQKISSDYNAVSRNTSGKYISFWCFFRKSPQPGAYYSST